MKQFSVTMSARDSYFTLLVVAALVNYASTVDVGKS